MGDWIAMAVEASSLGAGYGLLAAGLALPFGSARRLNLAYGACLLVGAYAAAWVHNLSPLGLIAAAAVMGIASICAIAYVWRLCFAHTAPENALGAMVGSFAIWMQLEELVALAMPGHVIAFPGLSLPPALFLGSLSIRLDHLFALPLALMALLAVHILLKHTRLGLGLRLCASQSTAAALVGAAPTRSLFYAFCLSATLGSLGCLVLLVPAVQVTPMFGMTLLLKALAGAMLGGLLTVEGAFAGGVLLGVLEVFVQPLLGASGRELACFVVLLVVLLYRPRGVFTSSVVTRKRT